MASMDLDHSLPNDADPIQPVPVSTTGRRSDLPQFTDEPMLDRLYGVTVALITELAVTRTRLDTLERVLARREVLDPEDVESFQPDRSATEARSALQQEYLQRVLRALG